MNTEAPIRVLCVDNHPLVRKGIASILADKARTEPVALAELFAIKAACG